MSFNIDAYQHIETLHEGANTVIYRLIRQAEPKRIIIKTLKTEYPTLKDIARLKHEYDIIQKLALTGIVKSYGLGNFNNRTALILEDCGGEGLKNIILSRPIGLSEFLSVAIQVTDTLGQIHQNQIIHKDIKPENLILNPKTWTVKITDFSAAALLSREEQKLSHPNLLEGTLAYMSPEQTGRMNRSIDYRTDFYSLGVTFYEIVTRQLPFVATDPLELVHCHIAKTPVPPNQLNPEIPKAVSDVVMKLLSKTAEDRYQSAYGIKVDLENCLNQWQSTGKIENFVAGQQDVSSKFQIPQKLYGREAEVVTLMDAFERVCQPPLSPHLPLPPLGKGGIGGMPLTKRGVAQRHEVQAGGSGQGGVEMMLVSGYSGIGKSSLVHEVHKPIVRQRGYFISGKFDQYKRNIPYASLIQAFQEMIRQLLTESEEKIASWKAKLKNALGSNGQVIIDVIPEVELIIGKQPSVPQLEPTESQNRFNLVFKNFIHVFTKKEHPLVLFLDDLQWADSASLKLIQLLLTDPDSRYLFMIGAYRDNEVSATHPFIVTMDEIRSSGTTVNNITLQPLKLEHISQLIADTLSSTVETVKPLAELVLNKTGGNPFFLTQLLKSLAQENLLVFDFSSGRWNWSLAEIQKKGITDNVVELMVSKIQKFSESTQNVLKLAACIGNSFDLEVLSIVNEKSLSATAAELWEALRAELILPLTDAYKLPRVLDLDSLLALTVERVVIGYIFLHDRVQQAAYSLIPEEHKKETHLKIGQLFFRNTTPEDREEKIFDIVNQLNFGIELITCQSEKNELAHLNLIAGRKAKASTAYEAAGRYLTIGLELLAKNSWHQHYDLTLALYVEAVEVAYLNTNFASAAELAEVVLQQARTILDKVKVYETQIQFCISQNKLKEAIAIDLQVLEMLGIPLCKKPPNALTKKYANALTIEDLSNLSPMTDPNKIAAMRILIAAAPPTYFADAKLFTSVIFTMVDLCIKHGNSALSTYAYACYGLILAGGMGEIDAGYQSCQLALKLLDQYDAKDLKPEIYEIFNGHVRHWKEHINTALEAMVVGIQSGLEVGKVQYASFIAAFYCSSLFFSGYNLEYVADNQKQYLELLRKWKTQVCIDYAQIWRQAVANLVSQSKEKCRLIGESFNEEEMLATLIKVDNRSALCSLYLAKAHLCYLYKNYAQSIENAKVAENYLESVMGTMNVSVHNFYYSLAILGLYPTAQKSEQTQYLKKVTLHQRKMKQWAQHSPMNYRHKYALVEAEKARVLGKNYQAMDYYDRAIESAREQGYIQEEALANELAAEFYFSLGKEKIAQVYLMEAYYGYTRWGATSKLEDLSERYAQVFSRSITRGNPAVKVPQMASYTTQLVSAALDLSTVIKASQAISDEIVLKKLLDKLMNILIENAGARTGLLLLSQSDKFVLVAEGFVERDNAIVLPGILIETRPELPVALINYVTRSQSTLVLNDGAQEGLFTNDSYIIKNKPKSILCLPIIYQSQLKGILYLENNLTSGAFTAERLEVLNLLSSQAAISLENAGLYQELRSYSQQLESKNAELITTNESLSAEITERKRVESERQQLLKQLEVERGLLEAVLRQMPAGVFIAEAPSGKIILANEQVEPIWRHAFLPCDNIEQYSQYNGFHPDGRQYSSPEWPLARSISTGEVVIGEEIKILRGDDTYGTIHVSSAPIRDPSNQIVAGVVTLYDITEKKRAENQLKASLKEKEVLLKEIHHRVKNNLQIISSLLYLQSRYIKDNQVLEIFKDSTNRVATMALIHEQLYQSKDWATIDFAEYIRNLVANLFASYEVNSEGIELKIKIDNVCLGIDTAVPCGLIINELVLNSLKYAFSEEKSGEICIEVQENDNKEFTLIVSDNGIGFPEELDFRNTKTLGCQLVMDLTEQLEGTIVLDKNLGTEFKITFPK